MPHHQHFGVEHLEVHCVRLDLCHELRMNGAILVRLAVKEAETLGTVRKSGNKSTSVQKARRFVPVWSVHRRRRGVLQALPNAIGAVLISIQVHLVVKSSLNIPLRHHRR